MDLLDASIGIWRYLRCSYLVDGEIVGLLVGPSSFSIDYEHKGKKDEIRSEIR